MCNKIRVIVDDLKKAHGEDKITFVNIKMGSNESIEAVKAAKLKSHGIIAKNAAGEIVKTVEGHDYGKAKIEKVVKALLKES